MAIMDEEIQNLQGKVQDFASADVGTLINTGSEEDPINYELVHSTDGTTQAIAVAPIVDGKTDYSQTAIIVYGTQPGANTSTYNAITAGVGTGMSAQYEEIQAFYNQTANIVGEENITTMSGYSQSGPPVAKVAAEHQVEKITNFADWGAYRAVASALANDEQLAGEFNAWASQM